MVEGELVQGLPDQGPYDVIFVNGAMDRVPEGLREQLADGGRLVGVLQGEKGIGHATLVTRSGTAFGHRTDFDANARMLPGFARKTAFVF